ncbi:MAG: heavy-metal-associated domain-containing protein [Clostridiales bacterium]|nr:heavy-metal-associated domain-containing protein [Clostridiales bacterium]
MENIINVEGMMCSGCENRIKNAIKAIPNVVDVIASHTSGTVKVMGDVDIATIKEKISDLGFEVVE